MSVRAEAAGRGSSTVEGCKAIQDQPICFCLLTNCDFDGHFGTARPLSYLEVHRKVADAVLLLSFGRPSPTA